MSKEAIIEADPDIIIVPVDQYSQAAFDGMIKGSNQSWMQGIKAMKNGKVYRHQRRHHIPAEPEGSGRPPGHGK